MKKNNKKKSSNASPKNKINQIDFKGLNDLFENNLKLYNSFVKGVATKNEKPKKNSIKQDFKPQDLYELISPTTNRIFESLNSFNQKIHKDPKLLFENVHIWLEDM